MTIITSVYPPTHVITPDSDIKPDFDIIQINFCFLFPPTVGQNFSFFLFLLLPQNGTSKISEQFWNGDRKKPAALQFKESFAAYDKTDVSPLRLSEAK